MISTQYEANLTQGIHNAVGVMHENLEKVSVRGQSLNALQDRAENLATSSHCFRQSANRVRKQMWWKEVKMRICLVVGVATLLCIIIIPSGKSDWAPTSRAGANLGSTCHTLTRLVPLLPTPASFMDGVTCQRGEGRVHGLRTVMPVKISEVTQFDCKRLYQFRYSCRTHDSPFSFSMIWREGGGSVGDRVLRQMAASGFAELTYRGASWSGRNL